MTSRRPPVPVQTHREINLFWPKDDGTLVLSYGETTNASPENRPFFLPCSVSQFCTAPRALESRLMEISRPGGDGISKEAKRRLPSCAHLPPELKQAPDFDLAACWPFEQTTAPLPPPPIPRS